METKLKLNKDKFIRFLQLIALKGDITTNESILTMTSDKIYTFIGTNNRIVAFRGEMKNKCNTNISIGLDNIILLNRFLSNFSSENIDISIQANKLVLTSKGDKLKLSIILRNPQYISKNIDETKYNSLKSKALGNEFKLDNSAIKKIIGYTESLGSKVLTLKGENKKLILQSESNENEIIADFEIKKNIKPFNVKFASLFIDLLSVLNSDITLSIKNNSPAYIKIADEDFIFEYIIAPFVK